MLVDDYIKLFIFKRKVLRQIYGLVFNDIEQNGLETTSIRRSNNKPHLLYTKEYLLLEIDLG